MNIFKDIWQLVSSLSLIDYILFFSVITLIMLIVSLVYILLSEKVIKKDEENLMKLNSIEGDVMKQIEEKEEIDLQNILETIDENPAPLIDMTAYEEEQEQKAIISYDELINEVRQTELKYDKVEMVDDVIPVKKISVNTLEEPMSPLYNLTPKEPKIEVSPLPTRTEACVKLFSYEKEEAFLKALKELNKLLN